MKLVNDLAGRTFPLAIECCSLSYLQAELSASHLKSFSVVDDVGLAQWFKSHYLCVQYVAG